MSGPVDKIRISFYLMAISLFVKFWTIFPTSVQGHPSASLRSPRAWRVTPVDARSMMDASHAVVPEPRLGNQSRLRGVRNLPHLRMAYLLLLRLLQYHLLLVRMMWHDHHVDETDIVIYQTQQRWTQQRRQIACFLPAFVETFEPKLTVCTIFFDTSLPIHTVKLVDAEGCARSRSSRAHLRTMLHIGVNI